MVSALHVFGKSATVGLIGGGIFKIMYPAGQLEIGGMTVSAAVAGGIAIMLGSVLSEYLVHSDMFSMISKNSRFSDPTSAALILGTEAGVSIGTMYALNHQALQQIGLFKVGAYGAVAEVAGSYLWTSYIAPWWNLSGSEPTVAY
jgi:hypothetical protein